MSLPTPRIVPSLGPGEMEIVERVLAMGSGYVLDFSDRTFDEFVAHEAGIDATRPEFSADGGSKARRLRRILRSMTPREQARLLRAFMRHRDSPAREGSMEPLEEKWRRS